VAKVLSYRHDHRCAVENREAFAKKWPWKKAHANRAYRRGVRVAVAEIETRPEGAAEAGIRARDPSEIRRRVVRKWRGTAVPLQEWVRLTQTSRLSRTIRAFWQDHDSSRAVVTPRVEAFFESLVLSNGPVARMQAEYLRGVLDRPHDRGSWISYPRDTRWWMRAVFAERPDLAARVRAWIERLGR
jgi:hypothetical protein